MTTKPTARIRSTPEDFRVSEIMAIEHTNDGEHLWLNIEKTGMNTGYLKEQLAAASGCPLRHISHSGLKDRHAVTEQWLCLPWTYADKIPAHGDGWRILERRRHRKKLRIGTHRENAFRLTLRDIDSEQSALDHALQHLRTHGFANRFGSQRFGRDNLAFAQSWVASGELPRHRDKRARVLSVLRAHLFNQQIDARGASAAELLSGDRAMLAGSHSHFAVDNVDDTLRARCQSGDIAPGGWLAGQGDAALHGEAGAIRARILEENAATLAYLARHSTDDWRPMWLMARDLDWQWQNSATLILTFRLPAGAYATTLLENIFTLEDSASTEKEST